MISILLRCIKHFKQIPKYVMFNQEKRIANFVIQWCSGSFLIMTRNLSTFKKENIRGTVYLQISALQKDLLTHGWIRKNKIEKILSNVNHRDDISSFEAFLLLQYSNIIMDCLPSERLNFGQQLWNHLSMCNIKMDSAHYNALLQIYLNNDHKFSPMDILTEMNDKWISPDFVTYETCIHYYCTEGNIPEAIQLIKNMKNLDFPQRENSYNLLIMGFSNIGDFNSINEIINNMIKNNIILSINTYTAIMCAFAKINNICKIKELIDICKSNNTLSNKTILSVICTLVMNNHLEHVDKMYPYLVKSSLFDEIFHILKLIHYNQVDIVKKILSYTRNLNIVEVILQNLVKCTKEVDQIIDMCTFFENEKMCRNPLLSAAYYSFFREDDYLCLPLLRACKRYYTIKPHYFWPILIKKANKYDFKGILFTLDTMIQDFHVLPCIETISDYVLPFSFDKVCHTRALLGKYIHPVIMDNAFILLNLKHGNLNKAAYHVKFHPGCYLYKVLANDLRQCLIKTNDVDNFLYVSSYLVECTTSNVEMIFNDVTSAREYFVSIEKQLIDFMANYPSEKIWIIKILLNLANKRIRLSPETINIIDNYLRKYLKNDVTSLLQMISNKCS